MENKNFTGSHAQKAENYFKSGYTCAQSVLLAFEDLTHIDSGTAFAMAAPFGGGVARMRDLCGAVSGMLMVAGILYAPKRPMNHEEKTNFYKLCQSLVQTFREKNEALRKAGTGAQSYAATMVPAVVSISYINYAVVAVLGGVMALNGQIDIGSLASYLVFVRQAAMPINQFTQQSNFLLAALAGAERVFSVMQL